MGADNFEVIRGGQKGSTEYGEAGVLSEAYAPVGVSTVNGQKSKEYVETRVAAKATKGGRPFHKGAAGRPSGQSVPSPVRPKPGQRWARLATDGGGGKVSEETTSVQAYEGDGGNGAKKHKVKSFSSPYN